VDDPKKEWQDGSYGIFAPPPKKIKKRTGDWILKFRKPGERRQKCIGRFCETLVNANINPYCRKCRRKKARKFGKAEAKKRREEKNEN